MSEHGSPQAQVWTLCANKRRGLEGAPMVLEGPRISLYDQIEVVPADRLRRLEETMRVAIAELSARENTDDAQRLREVVADAVTAFRATLAVNDKGWNDDN